MIHIIYWQLGQETSLPATFSSHLGSWTEGNWILHHYARGLFRAGEQEKTGCTVGAVLFAPCFKNGCSWEWILKMCWNIWKASGVSNFSLGNHPGLVPRLWCFNSPAFHFLCPNQSPSATSVPPCHSVRPWNPLSTNAWPVWEQLGDSEKCCDGFTWKLKGRCQMVMQ